MDLVDSRRGADPICRPACYRWHSDRTLLTNFAYTTNVGCKHPERVCLHWQPRGGLPIPTRPIDHRATHRSRIPENATCLRWQAGPPLGWRAAIRWLRNIFQRHLYVLPPLFCCLAVDAIYVRLPQRTAFTLPSACRRDRGYGTAGLCVGQKPSPACFGRRRSARTRKGHSSFQATL